MQMMSIFLLLQCKVPRKGDTRMRIPSKKSDWREDTHDSVRNRPKKKKINSTDEEREKKKSTHATMFHTSTITGLVWHSPIAYTSALSYALLHI